MKKRNECRVHSFQNKILYVGTDASTLFVVVDTLYLGKGWCPLIALSCLFQDAGVRPVRSHQGAAPVLPGQRAALGIPDVLPQGMRRGKKSWLEMLGKAFSFPHRRVHFFFLSSN